jgi:hypothetical protein
VSARVAINVVPEGAPTTTAPYQLDRPIRLVPNRADRRRGEKKPCCPLCNKPMSAHDRMPWRQPDSRPENWGLMAAGHAHPRCAAEAWRLAYEASQAALDALTAAAKKYLTKERQTELGLWTPDQGPAPELRRS